MYEPLAWQQTPAWKEAGVRLPQGRLTCTLGGSENKGTSTSQEQKQEQHLPIRHAALVMTELTKHIPEEAISEVQTRQDRSCTFYVHSDFVDTVLRASGQGNIFVKETVPTSEFHLLWLDEEVSLADASTMATDKACFGIAGKRGAARPKLALWFRNQEAMAACAKTNGKTHRSMVGGKSAGGRLAENSWSNVYNVCINNP